MSAAILAWQLARAGGWFRICAIIGGNAIGAVVFLLAFAIPAAIREPGAPADGEEALVARSVVVFLCLPVALLLLSIGRLSASTRDRRLASLRMLGLTPARTRLVAATENALFAAAGVALGLAGYLLAAPAVSGWAVDGAGWLRQPLHLSGPAVAAICGGVVLLSAVVSLAPTRSLQSGHMRVRRDGSATARPSAWRVVPLALGIAMLVVTLLLPAPTRTQAISQDSYAGIVLTGVVLIGLGIAVALPLAISAIATVLARRRRGVVLRLAANRLACEPTSTVRVVSGLAVAAFLITSSVGVIAAFASTAEYVAARHAYEEGPQRHSLHRQWLASEPMVPELTTAQIRRIEATPGVEAVIPEYSLDAGCGPEGFCGRVFVGSCAQLNLFVVVHGCRDTEVSLIGSGASGPIELSNLHSPGATVVLNPSPQALVIDEAATRTRFPHYDPVSLFVPAGSPQVAPILGEPSVYWVLTGPGQAPRDALEAATADLPVTLALSYLDPYWNQQRLQALLWTLAVVVLGIGFLSTLLTALDRAIERRRQIASQVVLGIPLHLLRGSQLSQALIPLWLALMAGIGLGFLPLVAILRLVTDITAAPIPTLSLMTVAALAAALVVAAATLPGIGGRLTPELLRRE